MRPKAEIVAEFEALMESVADEDRDPTPEEQQRAAELVNEYHEVMALH